MTLRWGGFAKKEKRAMLVFLEKEKDSLEKEEIARIQERIRAFNALRKIEREIDAQGGLEAVARRSSTNDDSTDPVVPPH